MEQNHDAAGYTGKGGKKIYETGIMDCGNNGIAPTDHQILFVRQEFFIWISQKPSQQHLDWTVVCGNCETSVQFIENVHHSIYELQPI